MKLAIILICFLASPLISRESPKYTKEDPSGKDASYETLPVISVPSPATIAHQKKFLYGTLALIPGGGISERKRNEFKGTALDYKVGVFPFVFDTVTLIPVLSVDYNYLHYFKAQQTSPYVSYGIGAAYIIPYVPLRAGIEFPHGFMDIGAKLMLGFIPSPEVRGGVSIKF